MTDKVQLYAPLRGAHQPKLYVVTDGRAGDCGNRALLRGQAARVVTDAFYGFILSRLPSEYDLRHALRESIKEGVLEPQ